MNARRLVGVLVAILVVFWIISAPNTAANTVNEVLASLASAGDSIIQFLRQLV